MKEKKEKMVLRDHYNSLPMQQKLKVRDEMIERSGISLITFYQKLRSDNFKKLERELLEGLLEQTKTIV